MQSLWMIAAALLFSVMGVCVKLLSGELATWEIVMYRGLIGVVVMSSITIAAGSPVKRLQTRRVAMHLRRGLSGTLSLGMWFYAIAGLPIATAMTLNYASPLFVGSAVAFLAWRAGRRVEIPMQLALLVGFCGVLLLLKPNIGSNQWLYATVGLMSATLSAVAYMSVKALGQAGEPEGRIVFYFSAMNALAGLIGSLFFGFHALRPMAALLLTVMGCSATFAQLALTRAYSSGRTLLTANLGFTGILFSTIFGFLFFGDRIRPSGATGMLIIIVSGIVATWMSASANADRRADAVNAKEAACIEP